MLSTFLRVREVFTLVSRHAAAGHRVHRRRTPAPRLRRPLPHLHAHQSRLGALLLEPPRPTVAWAHRRLPEPRRRLPCFAPPPLGFAEPAALLPRAVRAREPHHRAAAARRHAGRRRSSPPQAARPTPGRHRAPRRALPGGEEAPPTDQWGPLVSGVRGGVFFILCFVFG